MLGPEGQGLLYVARDWQDRIEPVEFGWTTVAGYNDYNSRDMTPRQDAGRYECGTLNTISLFGLKASLELIHEIGVDAISDAVRARADEIAAAALARGYELNGPERTPEHAAGIVSFRHPTLDARLIHARLKEAGFLTAPRGGWLRCSPHFYISAEDTARLAEALPAV
jgi:selenocysteine lyase/cysteine desulfurase